MANKVDREVGGLGTNAEGHKIFTLVITASDLGVQPLASSAEVSMLSCFICGSNGHEEELVGQDSRLLNFHLSFFIFIGSYSSKRY